MPEICMKLSIVWLGRQVIVTPCERFTALMLCMLFHIRDTAESRPNRVEPTQRDTHHQRTDGGSQTQPESLDEDKRHTNQSAHENGNANSRQVRRGSGCMP